MARRPAPVRTTLLCAIKFWSIDKGKTPTLRAGVRDVVRKQGFSPAAINRAERELAREGKLAVGGKRSGKTLRLLDDVDCSTVKLSPWTDDGHPGASLSGRRRKKPVVSQEVKDLQQRREQHLRAMGYAGNTPEQVRKHHEAIDAINAKLRTIK